MSYALKLFAFLVTLLVGVSAAAKTESHLLFDRWGYLRPWTEGKPLSTFPGNNPDGYVIYYMSATCLLVNDSVAEQIRKQAAALSERNIQVLGIYPETSTRSQMALHKQRHDFPFPVFVDVRGRLAAHLKATRSPQAFLLDSNRKVLYSGPVDSAAWEEKPLSKVPDEQKYLELAVEAFRSKQNIKVSDVDLTEGCPLPKYDDSAPRERVEYYPEIEKIIRTNCLSCHSPGGVGQLEFDTYEKASDHAETIKQEVFPQRMPPVPIVEAANNHPLLNKKGLSDRSRRLIKQWVEGGKLEGVPPKSTEDVTATQLENKFTIGAGGEKIEVIHIGPYNVPAYKSRDVEKERDRDNLDYQFFWDNTSKPYDRYIQEFQILPGDKRVVHHIIVFFRDQALRERFLPKDEKGNFIFSKPVNGFQIMTDFYAEGAESDQRVASYLPGNENNIIRLPKNRGIRVPANTDLVMEVHYTPIGKPVREHTRIGIVWAKEKPAEEILHRLFLHPRNFIIPPHDPHVFCDHEFIFEHDALILDVRPHMHMRGSDWKMVIVHKAGTKDEFEEEILSVPVYNFKRQHTYLFQTPIPIKAGVPIRTYLHWDNSRLNPNHKEFEREGIWGERTWQEMNNTAISYLKVNQ